MPYRPDPLAIHAGLALVASRRATRMKRKGGNPCRR